MLSDTLKQVKIAFILLVLLTILTGIIYPATVTILAQIFFPWRANGSLIKQNGKVVGSVLIGQSFTEAKYFWSRPSATSPYPYNADNSSGSNLGMSNPALLSAIKSRVDDLKKADPKNTALVPVDLVTASASGLDPEISPAAAFYQVKRIAKARGINEHEIMSLVTDSIIARHFNVLGEPRVNVLQLNLALDNLNITKVSDATTTS